MKYKDWLNEWLIMYVKPFVKDRTYIKYCNQTMLHILPILGELELNELDSITLQKWVLKLQEKGLSANTINSIISRLKDSLKKAVLFGIVDKEFSNTIIRPKSREKQIECFSRNEQHKIEQYIISKNKPKLFGIILTLYTGLRIGELLALTWKDVDIEKGLITITKSCHDSWNNGKYCKVIDTPKTENSLRVIPIPKQLFQMLKTLKKNSKSEYVVANNNESCQIRSYQKTFEKILNKLNISHKGFHSLRHTFATRALECGMDVKTLSEILGHKNSTITLNRYVHSLYEHKTDMMNKIGRIFQEM